MSAHHAKKKLPLPITNSLKLEMPKNNNLFKQKNKHNYMRFKPSHLLQILGVSSLVMVGINSTTIKNYEDQMYKHVESTLLILSGAGSLALGYYLKRKMPESDDWSR